MVDAPDGTPDESDGIIRDLERQIAELRANLDAATDLQNSATRAYAEQCEEIETLAAENARLRALPLKDEVERADFWAVQSKTGMHIGLWSDRADADEAMRQYEGGTIMPLFRSSLLSRLRAGEREGWRSMDSAPVGVDILVGGDLGHGWKSHVYQIRDEFWREDWEDEPTHWMPLPAAPSEQGGDRP